MRFFVVFHLVLLLACVAPLRADAPKQLRLSLIEDARRSMGVAWTTQDLVSSVVQFGLDTNYGQEQQASAQAHLVADIGYVHEVLLTGLSADTTYHYRVGDGQEWSDDASFTTAKASQCEPWKFIAMGDNRTQFGEGGHAGVSKNFMPILTEALAHQPNFILNSGDLVLDGHQADQWIDYLDSTAPFAQSIPMFTAMGNHDDDSVQGDGAKYNGIFYLPRNDDSDSEDYFSYRYENALFVILSTQTFNDTDAAGNPYGRQADYMEQVFQDNPDVTWRIVAYHHPSFTGGGAEMLGHGIGHEPNEKHQNAAFLPIFDRYHVDFVISGHNHWYERFYPLRQGSDPQRGVVQTSPDDGTIYITSGGAGAYTMDFSFIPMLDVCHLDDYVGDTRAVCSGLHHFSVFEFHDRSVEIKTWTTSCQNTDCDGSPELIDSLSFSKSGASQCSTAVDAGPVDDAATEDAAQLADANIFDVEQPVDVGSADDLANSGDDAALQADANVVTTADANSQATGQDAGAEGTTPPVQNAACGCSAQADNVGAQWLVWALFIGFVALRRRVIVSKDA